MRSLVVLATGVVFFSIVGMGACGGSNDTPAPSDAAADARRLFEAGTPDNFVPYIPQAPKCTAAPYPDAGVSTFDAGDTSDADVDAGDTDAQPPLGPPQLASFGGPVLHNPRIVPITYANDDLADQIEDFVDSFGCTDYWRQAVSEYGVGQAEMLTPVRLADASPATISDTQIAAFLGKQIKAAAPGFANAPADVLFAFYFQSNTRIELFGEQSCSSFDGYHSSTVVNGVKVSYAVMARCQDSDIDEQTATSSHEFVEATTDPNPESSPAYLQPDQDHTVWGFGAGGEAGDLCTFLPQADIRPDGYPFLVQRTWSNASILAGGDPCVPAPTPVTSEPFVAGIPDLPDVIPVQNTIGGNTTRGIAIAVGDSRTVDVHLYAQNASSMSWTISAHDTSQFTEGQTRLNLALDTTTATNGGVAHLTITRLSKGSTYGAEPFSIHSHYTGRDMFWYGVVGDPQ